MVDEVGVGVHLQTFVEENLAVRALASAHEEDKVVVRGKAADVRHPVGYLSADGVVILEGGIGRNVCLDVLHDLAELVQRLGGLRIQADVLAEIQPIDFVDAFDDDGLSVGLSHEAQYLGVSVLAVDYDLPVASGSQVELLLDAFLQA